MSMLKNPNPSASWSAGDPCFYREAWTGNIVAGIVSYVSGSLADVKGLPGFPDCTGRPTDTLFPSREEAAAADEAERGDLVRRYESGIASVEDLIRFAWDHPVARCEEYTDEEARIAFRDRAKDLLGIRLE